MKKLFITITLFAIVSCQNRIQYNNRSSIPITINSVLSTIASVQISPWKAIQDSSKISIPHNNRIRIERQKLLEHKQSFQHLAIRAEPYMHYIIDQLSKRNMPIELAIIPLMESAYNPKATSSAKAVGLWQIVPTTAKAYGMVSNRLYDQRRDLVASTNAALNYLQYLNNLFDGDWLLTIAAYNAGEGRIKRAQLWNKNHHLPTHFWALNLPNETMQYIPKLLSIIEIVQRHKYYGVALPEGNRANALVQFNLGEKIKLETIAQFTDLTLNELETYNAAYLKKQLSGPYHLLVPNHQAKQLYNNLVKNNFSNIEIVDLMAVSKENDNYEYDNVSITNNKYLTITDKDLQLYARAHLRYYQTLYQVKPGENLSSIAKDHKVPMDQLLQLNKIKNADNLKAGDKLVINIRNQ